MFLKRAFSTRARADEAGAPPPYPSCAGLLPLRGGRRGRGTRRRLSGAKCVRLLGSSPPSPDLNLKISVFFLFSHTLTADQRPLHCRFWGNRLSARDQFPITTHPPWEIWYLGCAGAHGHTRAPALPAASWPLRLCVFLKRAPSTRARARRGWGAAPLSQGPLESRELAREVPLRSLEKHV